MLPSGLAIFDIDGTLTDTNDVDDECFRRAVADIFRLDWACTDWSEAADITDSALARWLCRTHCRRQATDDELAHLVAHFVDLLQRELADRPERFLPIPGARGLFTDLRAEGWHVALATGCWLPSAALKLWASRLQESDLVLATANDALSRAEIVALARQRAGERYGRAFKRVVSVGDAPWDVRTAAALGHGFIGVGRRAVELRDAGASIVLPDLSDHGAVLDALVTAPVIPPRRRLGTI